MMAWPCSIRQADGLDFWESLEGMLVRVDDAVVVGPTNGFREAWVVGDGGHAATGVNRDGGITLAPGDFNPERIQLQAVTGLIGNPDIRLAVGDRIDHAVGVESYAFGNYEVVLTELGTVTAAARPPIRTRLDKAPDRLLIGSYNVENLDPKLEDRRSGGRSQGRYRRRCWPRPICGDRRTGRRGHGHPGHPGPAGGPGRATGPS